MEQSVHTPQDSYVSGARDLHSTHSPYMHSVPHSHST